jgi:cysteine-rich repeat protein
MRNYPRLLLAALSTSLLLLTACPADVCGDGQLGSQEQCDDGNTADGDGCSSSCGITKPQTQPQAVCGNGIRELGEQCDDANAASGDGCESTCVHTPPVVEQCAGAASLPQPDSGATCKVIAAEGTASGARLYMGVVLLDGKTLQGGQVLVDAEGVIQCAACDCSDKAAGAVRISCPQGVISPALINAHDHIDYQKVPTSTPSAERYEHRHDWRIGKDGHTELEAGPNNNDAATRWAELRQVMSGTTAVASSGGLSGLLRNLNSTTLQEGLSEPSLRFQTFPLGDSGGRELTSGCGYGTIDTPSGVPALTNAAYLPHVSEGIETSAYNEFLCLSGQGSGSQDLMTSRTAIIHGIGVTATEISKMAERHTGLVWSPRSNVSLYGDTAMVTAYRQMGVQIALGTDWLQSGSMNMLRELQCANYLNEVHYAQAFTDEELWRMATANAADLTDSWEKLGRIAPGKVADLAIFRLGDYAASPHRAVVRARAQDVVLTVRGGKPLYGDQAVVSALASETCDALEVCSSAKAVCVGTELNGLTFQALSGANETSYPLFSCDPEPKSEPTCVPQRTASTPVSAAVSGSNLYSGKSLENDPDGDGIGEGDNCPIVFNPIRPMDNGKQADTDNDGLGDACDICPLGANSTSCTAANPTDRDGDGIEAPVDNCPMVANAGQADRDGDGMGDACDLCASPNPGNAACPASIYAVKKRVDGKSPFVNQSVAIKNALVTAVADSGFFVQVREGDEGYNGASWSGLFVFTSPRPAVAVGDRVDIRSGTVSDYFGQIQLGNATFVKVGTGTMPEPVVVAPADIRTGGPKAAEYEGVLVQVDNVVVTKTEPSVGAGDKTPTKEFVVDITAGTDGEAAGVRVNDLAYGYATLPAVGTKLSYVRGVLDWRNNHSKIEPRDATDLAPVLASFGPSGNYVRVGTSGKTFPQVLSVTLATPYFENVPVTITSSDESVLRVTNGTGLVIPAGGTSLAVELEPQAQGSATLTATVRGRSLTTTVQVLGTTQQPSLTQLSPNPVVTGVGIDVTVTAHLDIPAPAGTTVDLSVTAGLGSVPATVTFAPNATTATFTFTPAGAPTVSEGTIVAQLGASSVETSVTLSPDAPILKSLTPAAPVILIQGSSQVFTVELNKPALAETQVKLSASVPGDTTGAPFGTVPATVTVHTGETTATFTFTSAATGNVTGQVSATLKDTYSTPVTVRTPYPKLASITPSKVIMPAGGKQSFKVALDKAAEAGGVNVAITLEPATGLGSLDPATVLIPEGAKEGTVVFTAGDVSASGTLRAAYEGVTLNSSVRVVVSTKKGLVINEVDYDNVGSDTKEFVELYNSSDAAIPLDNLMLVYINGASSTLASYGTVTLTQPGFSQLAPGEYLLIGPAAVLNGVTAANVKKITSTLAIQNGDPDAVGIYNKAEDKLVDSFSYGGKTENAGIAGTTTKFNFQEGAASTTTLKDSNTVEGSLSRVFDGLDNDVNAEDFVFASTPTPGAPNVP